MTGPFGTTLGPWIIEDDDSEFAHDYDVWISGNGNAIVCACWNNDARAIAQVPAMLALVQAASSRFTPHNDLVEMAREIVRQLEEKA